MSRLGSQTGPSGSGVSGALREMADIVDRGALLTAEHELSKYADPWSPIVPGRLPAPAPRAAVLPASVEEVRDILRIANRHRARIWTVSRGKNLGFGGAASSADGCIVLDLSRMNRIIEVNEEAGYALLEPGVSFAELYDYLRSHHQLWLSTPDLEWGSVVGNALDRGLGYTPYGDHSAMICGIEAVLANGDIVRTGMGAMTDITWQLYQPGFGPALDGLFQQSNMGVVTKLGIWLMPVPECATVCEITVPEYGDLCQLVDILRPLKLDGTIASSAGLVDALGAAVGTTTRDRWVSSDQTIREDQIHDIMATLGLGRWNLTFGLYGPEVIVNFNLARVKEAFGIISGAEIRDTKYPGNADRDQIEPRHRVRLGIPGMDALSLVNWHGGPGGHIPLTVVCPVGGSHAVKRYEQVQRLFGEFGLDCVAHFSVASPRHMNHTADLIYNLDDQQKRRVAGELFTVLVRQAAADGYGVRRTHVAYMDLVADQFGFNDWALRRLTEAIKDALDPHGILSPGKQGIWPRGSARRAVPGIRSK